MNGAQQIEQFKSAGFSQDEIDQWAVNQRDTLSKAGFGEQEVNTWFGQPEADTSKANAGLAKSVSSAFGQMGQTVKDVVTLYAPVEAALNLSTGLAFGFPAYLLAGGNAAVKNLNGVSDEDPKAIAERWSQLVTYQPRTEAGKRLSATVSLPLTALTELGEKGGKKISDITGSAWAGALTEATIQMLPAPILSSLGRRLAGKTPGADEFSNTAKALDATAEPVIKEKLIDIYESTGIDPKAVYETLRDDPTGVQELLSDNLDVPNALRPQSQQTKEATIFSDEPVAAKTPEERLADTNIRNELTLMKGETGWAQKGGNLLRSTEGMTEEEISTGHQPTGQVIGRTTWIPNAEWWPGRPKGLTEEATKTAIDKALAGEPLKAAEKRIVDYMTEVAEQNLKSAKYAPKTEELRADGLSDEDGFNAQLVSRASAIDEGLVERLAIQHPDDDVAFMTGIKEIIDGHDKGAEISVSSQARQPEATGNFAAVRDNLTSEIERRLESVPNGESPSQGWAAVLKSAVGAGKLKKVEISDLSEYIKKNPKATKDEVLSFIKQQQDVANTLYLDRPISEQPNVLAALDKITGTDNSKLAGHQGLEAAITAAGSETEALNKLAEQGIVGVRAESSEGPQTIPTKPTPPPGEAVAAEPSTTAEQKMLSRIKDESPALRKLSFNKLYTELIDRFNPIKVVQKESGKTFAEGIGPYELQRLTAGTFGKAQQFLQYGAFDFDTYKNVAPAYLKALDPIKADLNGFRAYMASRRAIELEGRGINSGMDLDAAKEVVKNGEAKFENVFQERLKYRDALTDYAMKAGLISKEAVVVMREANKAYVPFYRFFEEQERPSSGNQPRNPIKKIKGSEREILDPVTSDIKDTFLFMSLAEKNSARQALVNVGLDVAKPVKGTMRPIKITNDEVAKALKEQGIDVDADGFTAFRPASYNVGPNEIAVFIEGKRKVFEVDPEVARAYNAVDSGSASILSSMLRGASSWLRAGVTLSPDFAMRNPVRDAVAAFAYTGAHPIDTIKGAISLWKKDEAFQNWMKGGGANAAMVAMDRDYIHQELFKLEKQTGFINTAYNVIKSPLEALRIVSEITENITRIGVRRDELMEAKSKAQIQALSLIAREGTVDFARHGADPFFQQWQRATAFMNPAIQGVDLMFRKMAENPVGTTAKAFAAITLPSLYLWWANHNDPRWKDIPDWERDMFWIVMTKDHIYRVPKPFELGVLFGSVPERMLDSYVDEKPDAFKNFAKTMTNVFGFNVVPTAMAPLFEHMTNYSFFTDRPLIPSSTEKLLPEYQYTQYTTEATKAIGQLIGKFPGMHESSFASPAVIDNYIRGWTGTLGGYVVQIADAALRKTGALPDPVMPTKSFSDIPGIRAFMVRYPSSNAQSIQDFYDNYSKAQKVVETINYLSGIGDVEAAKKEMLLNPDAIAKLDDIHTALGQARRLVQLVNQNGGITADEKRQLIDSTYSQMIEMATAGNQAMVAIHKELQLVSKETVH